MSLSCDIARCNNSIRHIENRFLPYPDPRITLQVLPLGELTVMIPEPHATLQGVIILSAVLKIVFRHILFILFFKCSLGFDERRLSYRLRYTCTT